MSEQIAKSTTVLLRMLADDLVHPLDVRRDASIEAGVSGLSTSAAPADYTIQHPATVLVAYQRSAGITLSTTIISTGLCVRLIIANNTEWTKK